MENHCITTRCWYVESVFLQLHVSVAGLLDVMTVTGTSDGDTYAFVQTHLLPHLMPFNGVNPLSGYFGQLFHMPCIQYCALNRSWSTGALPPPILSSL